MGKHQEEPAKGTSGRFSAFVRKGRATGLPGENHGASGGIEVQPKQVIKVLRRPKDHFN